MEGALEIPARLLHFFGKSSIKSATTIPTDSGDRSDFGPASSPPGVPASLFLKHLTKEEQRNFYDLLNILQRDCEKEVGAQGLQFHPDARACFWGVALNKIADHYHDRASPERSLFFMEAAWKISAFPLCARNAAFLSLSLNDLYKAHEFLSAFIATHQTIGEARFGFFEYDFKQNEIQRMIETDKKRLAIIAVGNNPSFDHSENSRDEPSPSANGSKSSPVRNDENQGFITNDDPSSSSRQIQELIVQKFTLPDLSSEQSLLTICAHLFEPPLLRQFVSPISALEWCSTFVEAVLSGLEDEAIAQYDYFEENVQEMLKDLPRQSISQPPFSIASGDGRLPSLPWRTPGHGETLIEIISGRASQVTPFGEMLQIAFITAGGPGKSKDDAIRVRARHQTVRAFCEHWLMRLFKASYLNRGHFSLAPDLNGKRFSQHVLEDPSGQSESLFFDTTDSIGREREDFIAFLDGYRLSFES